MKKTLLSLLFLFVTTACFTGNVFAQAAQPIPGVDISAKKNPGGVKPTVVRTDNNGKFSMTLEAGSYELSIDNNQVERAMGTAKSTSGITLTLTSSDSRSSIPPKITISRTMPPARFTIQSPGTTVSGRLTY